jgi:cytochrome P450
MAAYAPRTSDEAQAAAADGFDNFDYRIAGDVRDPYPELAEQRRTQPVMEVANPLGDMPPTFLVYRYEDVCRVLQDYTTFSSSILTETMGPSMGYNIILGLDEPEHHRHRSLVATAFRAKTMARWESTLVQDVVDRLIDQFAPRGAAELVYEFTYPFPTQVVAGILGLPREDYRQFQQWAIAINNVNSEWDPGVSASEALKQYLAGFLDQRRNHPEDDLISLLATAEFEGERLDDEEIFSFLRLILPAGVETTFRSSGNLLLLLLTHPDQLEAVRGDRSLLPQAIEEALRLEPPLLITSRRCTQDTELSGVKIPAGASVTPVLGAANRDEERYPDPDRFDIYRDPKQHISFGFGTHMCLGMHLARIETRVAINSLLDRLPSLRLDPDRVAAEDPHIHGEIFRSPTSLPVIWG